MEFRPFFSFIYMYRPRCDVAYTNTAAGLTCQTPSNSGMVPTGFVYIFVTRTAYCQWPTVRISKCAKV